jgi:hypothetical protein
MVYWRGYRALCETRGSPGCVMRSATTFANYLYPIKFRQPCSRLCLQSIAILTRTARSCGPLLRKPEHPPNLKERVLA